MLKKISCIILAGFFGLLLINTVFAAGMEEIESNYQNGIKYGNQGNVNLAIESFQKVLLADYSTLPRDYYKQTYGDAYLNLGILYMKKADYNKAVDDLNKALDLVPDSGRAIFYLAMVNSQLGEIAKVKLYYNKFKSLGAVNNTQSDDFLRQFLSNYQEKEISIAYNYFFNPGKNVKIAIRGDFSGNEQLLRDTLTAIEKIAMLKDFDSNVILTQVIRQNQKGTLSIEKWTVGPANSRKDFWVKYNFDPPQDFPSKVMITVSDREMTLDEK
ncbi:MAG: tetratricopeptide repeat protein [Candidatus Omnitrophica bacterium]|nr:tetratricopeptide repeat protein [Candidatus Omnitrophota bacterium]